SAALERTFVPLLTREASMVGRRMLTTVRVEIVQVGVAVVYCLLSAGIVFGYAALKPVLKSEGAYRAACTTPGVPHLDKDTCVEIPLNFMFTVAAVASNLAALPIGSILDHYGPRVSGVLGS